MKKFALSSRTYSSFEPTMISGLPSPLMSPTAGVPTSLVPIEPTLPPPVASFQTTL